MKILSLFDGISCARVALERAGIPVEEYYASEIDKYAIQIAQKNYPDTTQLGNVIDVSIKKQGWRIYEPDLLIGGSPCQDLSIAKKERKGLDGERSGLFWEYVRILKELKPKYFILENVNSMPKEAKYTITEALGVEPVMINAALVSAQNRKRLFWVGKWNGNKHEQVVIPQPEDRGILLKDILEESAEVDKRMVVNGKSFSVTASYGGAVEWNSVKRKQRTMVRVGQIGKGGQGDRIYSPEGKPVNLSANGGGRGAKTGLYLVDQNLNKMVSSSYEEKRKESKLDDRTLEGKKKLRTERGNLSNLQRAKKNRNTSQERRLARQSDRKSGRSMPQLPHEASPEKTKVQIKNVQSDTSAIRILRETQPEVQKVGQSLSSKSEPQASAIVRKLTCIECERLQSLPDNYTEGISNTQRYKCLGNAFNVEVVAHILKNIFKNETY